MRFVRSRNFLISSLFVLSLMLLVVAANMPSLAQGAPQQVPPSGPPPAANPGPAPGRGAGGGGGFPSAAEMKGKTAGQVFKNLQVLANVPAEDFLPSMNYIAVSLGVRCDYCHVPGQNDSDQKPTKQMARAMMRMVSSINSGTFNSQRKVACYTCHRGAAKPVTIPPVAMLGAMPATPGAPAPQVAPGAAAAPGRGPGPGVQQTPAAPAPAMPAISDILGKYTSALGGQAAVQKLTARTASGTFTQGAGSPTPIEEVRKAPNKAAYTLHGQRGDNMQGYDGANGWTANPFFGAADSSGDTLVRLKEWADFYPGLSIQQEYQKAQVDSIEQIDGHDVYRVLAYRGNDPDRFYFDKDSGLLVRFYTRVESALGALPQETTYDDYRDVNGVKVPFTVRVATVQNVGVYKWDKIDATAAVDDARFNKPNITPAPRGGPAGAPTGAPPAGAPPAAAPASGAPPRSAGQ